MPLTPQQEAEYGLRWRMLAQAEGHEPRLPVSEHPHQGRYRIRSGQATHRVLRCLIHGPRRLHEIGPEAGLKAWSVWATVKKCIEHGYVTRLHQHAPASLTALGRRVLVAVDQGSPVYYGRDPGDNGTVKPPPRRET